MGTAPMHQEPAWWQLVCASLALWVWTSGTEQKPAPPCPPPSLSPLSLTSTSPSTGLGLHPYAAGAWRSSLILGHPLGLELPVMLAVTAAILAGRDVALHVAAATKDTPTQHGLRLMEGDAAWTGHDGWSAILMHAAVLL